MKKLVALGLLALVSFLATPAATLLAGSGQTTEIVADGGGDYNAGGG